MKKSKQTIELEQKLTLLLGKTSYTCTKRACRGKWKGTYDYSMLFNDNTCLCVSTGLKGYHKKLEDFIKEVEFFITNRDKLSGWIKEVLKANDLKTPSVKNMFDRLYLITDDNYMCSPAFDFHTELDGLLVQSFTFLEGSFCDYCLGREDEKYPQKQLENGFCLEFGQSTLPTHPKLFI